MITNVGTHSIDTQRLLLRRFEYSDNASMRKYWVSDKNVQSMYREPVYTTESEVNELLDRYIGSYQNEDYYRWAIIDKSTSECIGQIAYYFVDSNNNYAEIEYCIGSAFQRNGFATEATKAVIKYGFNVMHLHKIQICSMTINDASIRVIEKCGFKYEGILRDCFYINEKYIGRAYFSLLRDEYVNSIK